MKPHIYKYSRIRLLLSSKDRSIYASTASVPGIPSAEYTIGVKECQCSRHCWGYLYFFSFYAVYRDFVDV